MADLDGTFDPQTLDYRVTKRGLFLLLVIVYSYVILIEITFTITTDEKYRSALDTQHDDILRLCDDLASQVQQIFVIC
jgi:hypothetical protein